MPGEIEQISLYRIEIQEQVESRKARKALAACSSVCGCFALAAAAVALWLLL